MNKILAKYIFSVFLLLLSTQALWAQSQTEFNFKLLLAAKNNYTDSVKYWLEKGADINYADENGFGALHFSISFFNNELCKYLINEGASVNEISQKYIAPIFSVAGKGNLHAAYLLYKNGANINIKSSEGLTALNYAERLGYLRVAKFLENQSCYSIKPTFGEYFVKMNEAYLKNNYGLAYFFADSAYEAASSELKNDNPYFISIEEWMKKLPSIALYDASAKNQSDSVKYWVEKGGDVNYWFESGYGALHQAIANDNLGLCEFLISKGAKVNGIEGIVFPPIFTATMNGNLRSCYELYAKGADLNVKDAKNKTALDYAIEYGYIRVADFLEKPDRYSKEPTFNEFLKQSNIAEKNKMLDLAIEYSEKANEAAIRELSPKHHRHIAVLQNLALLYGKKGNFNLAKFYFQQVIDIQKEVFGEDQPLYAYSLSYLASIYSSLGLFNEAEKIIYKALEVQEKNIATHQQDYAQSLQFHGTLKMVMGEYYESEKLFLESIKLQKETNGEYNLNFTSALKTLGTLYRINSRFEDAENILLKVLQIEKELDENQQDYALTLVDLAKLYLDLGQYAKSEKFFLKGLEIKKEIYGDQHQYYAQTLSSLGDLYVRNGNLVEAEKVLKLAIDIQKETVGEKDLNYANTLTNLANAYFYKHQFDKSIELNLVALNIRKENLGTKHSDYIQSLNNLATIYSLQGLYDLSDSIYSVILPIQKEIFGENNPSFADYVGNQAINFMDQKRYELAYKSFFEESEIRKSNFSQLMFILSSYERSSYWNLNIRYFNIYLSFSYRIAAQDSLGSSFAFNNELFTNALLLNISNDIQQSILNSKDTILISTFETFKNLRRQVNYLQQQPIEKQQGLPELEEKANQLDKQLTKASQAYQQNKENLNIEWQDVQKRLKEGEAAVQFISFPYYNKQWTDSTMYCALIVKPGMEYPAMVPLFEEKLLQTLLEEQTNPYTLYAYRGTKVSYANTPAKSNGDELYQLIWQPLQSELNEVQTVYFAPSGLLHKVSFSALPVDSTKLLCDQFSLHRLSSTRQLALQDIYKHESGIKKIALFGGIDYNLSNQSWSDNKLALTYTESILSRGFSPDSSQRSTTFTYLDGTKQEVENIASIVKRNNEFELQYYTADKATEEAFKKLSNQNFNLIHIATHGFFFPSEHKENLRGNELQILGEQRFRYVPNPLLRSGLLMAGANRTWKGDYPKDSLEDGVLTAQEISEMNLLNTELVVLSACETGLGDINNSEGVFGLQRAFKLAGVKTLIMSLWKVPDKQTSMLMQAFYTNWLGGMSKHEAFKKAQLSVRETHPEPYYWAGFVMVD
jgi:CHAT domain-containing protein/ankyrin repeat protein